MTVLVTNPVSAATPVRSLVDRADDVNGYQVHLVYVALNGSVDVAWDTNGKIDSWVTEANSWLMAKVGRKFIFDTYQGSTDVTFMQSKYTAAELCSGSCQALKKLETEYAGQDISYNRSKSLVFVIYDNLDPNSCGWARRPGNLALVHDMAPSACSGDQLTYGLSFEALCLIHELIHTYGISHKCSDSSDLMIGSPECSGSRGNIMVTLDNTRTQYVGSDTSDGIDLLKMPIWNDSSGSATYSQIMQISDTKYIPTLRSGTIYAVVGKQSGKFDWSWEKAFYPDGVGMNCQFTSGLVSVTGTQSKSACVFDVPNTLRAGKPFTVSQSWVAGPWHGEASVTGVLARNDLSTNPCTRNTCFVGGTTTADYSCWTSNVKSLTLQQLINDSWVDSKTVGTVSGSHCLNSDKYMNYPELTLNFPQAGLFVYRWFFPGGLGVNSYTDTPFVVLVNDENSAEPSQDEVTSAQTKAIELGKAADAKTAAELKAKQEADAKAAAELKAKQEADAKAADDALAAKAAKTLADKAAAVKKSTTISCMKGKAIKRVTGISPKCPSGYSVKR
jgi:hypothetical protein